MKIYAEGLKNGEKFRAAFDTYVTDLHDARVSAIFAMRQEGIKPFGPGGFRVLVAVK
jgi:hypothetical protein